MRELVTTTRLPSRSKRPITQTAQRHQEPQIHPIPWSKGGSLALRCAVFAVAIFAIRHQLGTFDRAEVVQILRGYGWRRVALGFACTVASFLTLGRIEIVALCAAGGDAGRRIPRRSAFLTAFVSHAFSQSIDVQISSAAANDLDTAAYGRTPEWLIDNAEAYDRILRAIGSARRSLWVTQLAFDADCVAYKRDLPAQPDGAPSESAGTVLAEAVLAAVARAPVDVRILLNATLLLDTARPLGRFFAARLAGAPPAGSIRVRGVSCFPQLLHAKMIIVDGREAFLLGSPFANGYWDDPHHHPVDARRPVRELGGRPLHDVSLRLMGSPVAELERVFAELWNHAAADSAEDGLPDNMLSGERADACGPAGNKPIRIVCTSPRGVLPASPGGTTEIMDALMEGIAGARSLIYVEHQYLSSRPVVAALADALRREPDLELIVVLNQNPDVTAYRRWQNARLGESGFLNHPRAGVFALWSPAPGEICSEATVINQVFVHSKVVAVDDRWATVGSANLDGVSLHSYGDDFTGPVARRVFRNVRSFDVNVIVREPAYTEWCPGTIASLRTRLWSEHLGMSIDSLVRRPAGGWLPLWRARAAANIAALAAGASSGDAARMRGLVLPYSTQPTPATQLTDLGVNPDPARLDVRFNPSWLEVHFSPNWVRNMFP